MLSSGKLKGSISMKLSTKEFKDGIYFGWEITDFENGQKIEETVQKKKIEPTGTIMALRDYFKPVENIGVFKKED